MKRDGRTIRCTRDDLSIISHRKSLDKIMLGDLKLSRIDIHQAHRVSIDTNEGTKCLKDRFALGQMVK